MGIGKLLPNWRTDRGAPAEETSWELLAWGLNASQPPLPPIPLSSLRFAFYCYSNISVTSPGSINSCLTTLGCPKAHPTDSIQTQENGQKETERGWLANKDNMCILRERNQEKKNNPCISIYHLFFFHVRYVARHTFGKWQKKRKVQIIYLRKSENKIFSYSKLKTKNVHLVTNFPTCWWFPLAVKLPPPPLHPLFTVTWHHLMKGLTPAYRIKLISAKQGSVEGGGGGSVGTGKTTTGGQERGIAGRRHNKERATRWLMLGFIFCWMLGVVLGVGGDDFSFWWRKGGGPKWLVCCEDKWFPKQCLGL